MLGQSTRGSPRYAQAIMDLGATCCTLRKPDCEHCPLMPGCLAKRTNTVAQLPHKKPTRIKPIKEQQFLVLHTVDHLLYLEKQPPVGIWGGLWCFPALELNECPHQFIASQFEMQTNECQPIIQFKHTFSHFHLHIKALAMRVQQSNSPKSYEPRGKWFALNELQQLGLAKPTTKIIQSYLKSHGLDNSLNCS
jgi:A/G-specific adenine glycosylase